MAFREGALPGITNPRLQRPPKNFCLRLLHPPRADLRSIIETVQM
jgi:hypothetical protein